MKALKLSEYFQIIRPEYVYLKLTPANSIRNYQSEKIAKAVASLYRGMLQRIKKQNRKYFFEVPSKIAYYIYIEKQKVEFYFIVPSVHLNLIKEKISDTWNGITITKVDTIPSFTQQAVRYKLTYRKEDALSLAVDRRTNTLLGSILNVIDVIEEGDRVGVFYNFIPVSQYSWRADYERTLKKLQDNLPIDREKLSIIYAIKMILTTALSIIDILMDSVGSFMGESKKEKQTIVYMPFTEQPKPLLPGTHQKKDASIIETQIMVLSESQDGIRATNSAYSICEAFKSITGDNELIYKRSHAKDMDLLRLRLPGDAIKTSPAECQNLIALPGRELLEEHKIIEKIDTFESMVPDELKKGTVCIGENTYRGQTVKAYLTSDREYRNLALVIIGPTRAGKTTLIANNANDTVSAGECTILFDFCGNCELSSEVSAKFSKDKVLVIDCENSKTIQGLGYNEVRSNECDTFKAYRNAKVQTSQLMTLTNCINSENKELSAKMDRYLESAALVVFISGGPIRDVFATLQNHIVRHRYIDQIPAEQKDNMAEYTESLFEIDDVDKKPVSLKVQSCLLWPES